MITIKGLSTLEISGAWTNPHHDISANPGQTVSIVGPSGSGKTALCLALCGLTRGAEVRGSVTLDGRDVTTLSDDERATLVAYVPTDPSLLFSGVKSTLRGEFELAWQLLNPISDFSHEHIARAVAIFRVEHLLDRDPFTFSGGEATRAAIALALAKLPRVAAIDQGYQSLDPEAVVEIRHAITRLLPDDAIAFETFSRTPWWLEAVGIHARDHAATLDPSLSGAWRIHFRSRKTDCASVGQGWPHGLPVPDCKKQLTVYTGSGEVLLNVRGLEFHYLQSSFKLGPLELSVRIGERVALRGPNGIGKTTLLKCLAMLVQPRYRALEVRTSDGKTITPPEPKQIHRWAGTALYCFQNPDDQIYLPTVREELFETARRVGNIDSARILGISAHFALAPFLDASPSELPRPYRRLICIAAALAAGTPILLLDEPSADLDEAQTRMLANALLEFRPPHSACIMVSHDENFIAATANRIVEMAGVSSSTTQADKPHLDPTCATHS